MSRNRARPKNNTRVRGTSTPNTGKTARAKMATLLDDLESFYDYRENILPEIRRDLEKGMKPEQLRQKYAALVQARQITDALLNPDASKAQAASKDILDRTEGKAKERVDHTHRLQSLPDNELDAVLESQIQDLKNLEDNVQ